MYMYLENDHLGDRAHSIFPRCFDRYRSASGNVVLACHPPLGALVEKVGARSNILHRGPGLSCSRRGPFSPALAALGRGSRNELDPDWHCSRLMLADDMA